MQQDLVFKKGGKSIVISMLMRTLTIPFISTNGRTRVQPCMEPAGFSSGMGKRMLMAAFLIRFTFELYKYITYSEKGKMVTSHRMLKEWRHRPESLALGKVV